MDPLGKMELKDGAAWKDAWQVQWFVNLVAEELFALENWTEAQNQEDSVVAYQEQVVEPSPLGHQLG